MAPRKWLIGTDTLCTMNAAIAAPVSITHHYIAQRAVHGDQLRSVTEFGEEAL
ncbi:hypothetical protein [Mycobacterium lepromatosis]|uniref:hypothetical protein n=1 Tax=Mycobacterium lepromatosis TaxID=480418 RepID=UPI0018727822|nr:hypothetical protein [Mycobacterium lepromatosis]